MFVGILVTINNDTISRKHFSTIVSLEVSDLQILSLLIKSKIPINLIVQLERIFYLLYLFYNSINPNN